MFPDVDAEEWDDILEASGVLVGAFDDSEPFGNRTVGEPSPS